MSPDFYQTTEPYIPEEMNSVLTSGRKLGKTDFKPLDDCTGSETDEVIFFKVEKQEIKMK
jgi:hypothetical protein